MAGGRQDCMQNTKTPSTPAQRVSDADCFSALADVHTPRVRVPPCAKCGGPSLGGVFVSQEPVSPAGAPKMTVEFYCKEDAPGDFVMMSDRLFPVWKILSVESASKMSIQKLPREMQIARVQPDGK